MAEFSVDVLALEVETLDEPLYVSSPLWNRVRIDKICRDCELEISGILSQWTFGLWTYRILMSFLAWIG